MKSDDSVGSVDEDGSEGSAPVVIDMYEFKLLAESLGETEQASGLEGSLSVQSKSQASTKNISSMASDSDYGRPLSEQAAAAIVPPGNDGMIRYAIVIPDVFCVDGKLTVGGLNKRDFDLTKESIKPRRASLPLTRTDLLSSLTKTDGPDGPRYIFNGVLNGWPSLRNFELVELEKKRSLGPLTPPDYMNNVRHAWTHYWSAENEGAAGISPEIEDESKIYRAKLRGAPWSSIGW